MSDIDKKQGAVKQSEVAIDEAMSVISTPDHTDAMTVVKQLQAISSDALTKASILLMSKGRILWSGTQIVFNNGGNITDALIKILQTSPEAGAQSIDLFMKGSNANSVNTFQSISLASNEVLYLQLNRATLNAILSGTLDLENDVGGSSAAVGYTLKKALVTSGTGVPKLMSTIDQTSTDTLNIPIAYATTYTVGLDTFKDIWWIPHGIRWPEGTSSTLGAVITAGSETYPSLYVAQEADLIAAMTVFSGAGGGVCCLSGSFTVNANIIVPDNTILLSRGTVTLDFAPGAKLTVGSNCTLKDFDLTANASFNNEVILVSGQHNELSNLHINLTNAVDNSTTKGIYCNGAPSKLNRIERCSFYNVTATSKLGIHYGALATLNYDLDSEFT